MLVTRGEGTESASGLRGPDTSPGPAVSFFAGKCSETLGAVVAAGPQAGFVQPRNLPRPTRQELLLQNPGSVCGVRGAHGVRGARLRPERTPAMCQGHRVFELILELMPASTQQDQSSV